MLMRELLFDDGRRRWNYINPAAPLSFTQDRRFTRPLVSISTPSLLSKPPPHLKRHRMTSKAFKAIIVGGGPVGLTAAHSLSRANLDFVVLEQRPKVVLDAGSNLVLLPIGLRVLSQLGLLPAIEGASSPMDKFRRIDHNSKDIGDTLWFTHFKDK